MSQPSKNRRTPLSLGQQLNQKSSSGGGNGRKGGQASDDAASGESRSNTPIVDMASAVVASDNATIEQLRQKHTINLTGSSSPVFGARLAKENAAVSKAKLRSVHLNEEIIVIDDNSQEEPTKKGNAGKPAAVSKRRESTAVKKDGKKIEAAAAAPPPPQNGSGKAAESVAPAEVVVVEAAASAVVGAPAVGAVPAESPRLKVLREKYAREEAERLKLAEAKEIGAAIAAIEAQEVSEKNATATAATSESQTPEKGKRKDKLPAKASPVTTPSKKSAPKVVTPAQTPIIIDLADANAQTPIIIDLADDVMETLQMETEADDDDAMLRCETLAAPPTPPAPAAVDGTPKSDGKILKLSQSPLPAVASTSSAAAAAPPARFSPFVTRHRAIEATVDASTMVNLSTVSEQSNEYSHSNSPALLASGSAATKPDGLAGMTRPSGSLHDIIGRPSIRVRELRELALLKNIGGSGSGRTETYRRTRTELDDSISSMNVTVGSAYGDDDTGAHSSQQVETLARGRKRTTAQLSGVSEPDLVTAGLLESPKKARLDLSGFFGMVSTPVTLLRNKFSRTSLLSSTPNAKKLDVDAAEPEAVVDGHAAAEQEEPQLDGGDAAATAETAATAATAAVAVVHEIDAGTPTDVSMAEEVVEEAAKLVDDDDVEEEVAQLTSGMVGDAAAAADDVTKQPAEDEKQEEAEEEENDDNKPITKPKKSSCLIM